MFSTFLLAYDGTREGRDALREATDLAKRIGARIHLVCVASLTPTELAAEGAVLSGLLEVEEEAMRSILAEGIAALRQDGVNAEGSLVVGLSPATEITALATKIGADLIVVGHRDQSLLARLWNGSVGQQLIAHAPCSVLIAVTARPRTANAAAA